MRRATMFLVLLALLSSTTAPAANPVDSSLSNLRKEFDDLTTRLAAYGDQCIQSQVANIEAFRCSKNRLPSYREADSLFGMPRTTRAFSNQRAGRVTYLLVDEARYKLYFWDLDGTHWLSYYSYGSWSDEMDPEVTEWLFDFLPTGHISWAMYHDENPQWTHDMIVTACEEIATRRSFKSYIVRDAPGLLGVEHTVVQAVESCQFTDALRPRAIMAIEHLICTLHDESLRERLQRCLDRLRTSP